MIAKRRLSLKALAGLGALSIAAPAGVAYAHHAFSAEFDADAPVLLKGEVTRVEWVNPHTWIHMAARQEAVEGEEADAAVLAEADTQAWMVEGGTPNTLLRAGLNRKSLKIGTEIIVRGYQSKDRLCEPACKANGRDITFTDGRKIFMGSSGTGAPLDGADPRERRRRRPN